MTTIKYAVLVPFTGKNQSTCNGGTDYRVEHLYQHKHDADQCVKAYHDQLATRALAVSISQPLAIARNANAWVTFDPEAQAIHPFVSRQAALKHQKQHPGQQLIEAPIRQAMPLQNGTPQFVQTHQSPASKPAQTQAFLEPGAQGEGPSSQDI